MFKQFQAQWTPTILLMDAERAERHRIEGFLPADDFLAQLELGLGKLAFQTERFQDAEKHFENIVRDHPSTASAAEAAYWAGVSRYKATNDAAHLEKTAEVLSQKFGGSEWAKKASVWASQNVNS